MEDVSNALSLLTSLKVTERKKGADSLRKCLEHREIQLELVRGSSPYSRSATSHSCSSWDSIFEHVRTYVCLELEKAESAMLNSQNNNNTTLRTSLTLNSTFSSTSLTTSKAAKTRNFYDVVSLVKFVLDLGLFQPANGITPSLVIVHVLKILYDELARSLLGNDYLLILNKYVLGNPECINEIKPNQWNSLSKILFKSDYFCFNPANLAAGCKAFVKSATENYLQLDFSPVYLYFKNQLSSASKVDKSLSLLGTIYHLAVFVFDSFGSFEIISELLFPILPAVLGALSKLSVSSLTSKDGMVSFLTITTRILMDSSNDEEIGKLCIENLDCIYECVVHSIELDLQQCDPKFGVSRKMKMGVSRKDEFFELVAILANFLLNQKLSSKYFQNCVDAEVAEPASKRQKKELKLNSWADYASCFEEFSNELSLTYTTELLIHLTNGVSKVVAEGCCAILIRVLKYLQFEDYSQELKLRLVHLAINLFRKFDSFALRSQLCHHVTLEFVKYACENISSTNIGEKMLELVSEIVHGPFQISTEIVELLLAFLTNYFEEENNAGCSVNGLSFLKLANWGFHNNLIANYQKNLKGSWSLKNDTVKRFIVKVIRSTFEQTLKLMKDCFEHGLENRTYWTKISNIKNIANGIIAKVTKFGVERSNEKLNLEIVRLFADHAKMIFNKQLVSSSKDDQSQTLVRSMSSMSLLLTLAETEHVDVETLVALEDLSRLVTSVLQGFKCPLQPSQFLSSFADRVFYDFVLMIKNISKSSLIGNCLKDQITESLGNFVDSVIVSDVNEFYLQQLKCICRLILIVGDDIHSSSSQSLSSLISFQCEDVKNSVNELDLLEDLLSREDFLREVPNSDFDYLLMRLTNLSEQNQKDPKKVERILDIFHLTIPEAFNRKLSNFSLVPSVTLFAFWSLVRTCKLKDPRAISALVKLTNEVARVKTDFTLMAWSEDASASSQNEDVNSEDYSMIAELLIDQLLKGNKLISKHCIEGLKIYANRNSPMLELVLSSLIGKLEASHMKSMIETKNDKKQTIVRGLMKLFDGIEMWTGSIESSCLQYLAKLLDVKMFSTGDVEKVVANYASKFEISSHNYFSLIIEPLVKCFKYGHLSTLTFFDPEIYSHEIVSCSVEKTVVESEDLLNSCNVVFLHYIYPHAVVHLLAKNDFSVNKMKHFLKMESSELVSSMNLKYAGLIIHRILSRNDFENGKTKIVAFLEVMGLDNSTQQLRFLEGEFKLQEQLLSQLDGSFAARPFETIAALKVQLNFLKLTSSLTSENEKQAHFNLYLQSLFAMLRSQLFMQVEILSSCSSVNLWELFVTLEEILSELKKTNWLLLVFELPGLLQFICEFCGQNRLKLDLQTGKHEKFEKLAETLLNLNPDLTFLVDSKQIELFCNFLQSNFSVLFLEKWFQKHASVKDDFDQIVRLFSNRPESSFFLPYFVSKLVNTTLSCKVMLDAGHKNIVQKLYLKIRKASCENENLQETLARVKPEDLLEFLKTIDLHRLKKQEKSGKLFEASENGRIVVQDQICTAHLREIAKILLENISNCSLQFLRFALIGLRAIAPACHNFNRDCVNSYLKIVFEEIVNLKLQNNNKCEDRETTALSYPQFLTLSIIDKLPNNDFKFLREIVTADNTCALKLLPVLITMLSGEQRLAVSKVFNDQFEKFLELKKQKTKFENEHDQVLPFFNSVLGLMRFQKNNSDSTSYLFWLRLDFDVLSKVAYELNSHIISIFFADFSIMSKTDFASSFGSQIPIDDSCSFSEQLIESGLKTNCEDTTDGLGLNRHDSTNLQLMAFQHCEQGDSEKVSQMLSLIPSIKSSGPQYLSDLVRNSPFEDFVELSKFCSDGLREDTNFSFGNIGSHLLSNNSEHLSNWSHLNFLESEESLELNFYSLLNSIDPDEVGSNLIGTKFENCCKLLAGPMLSEPSQKADHEYALKTFDILKSLRSNSEINFIENWQSFESLSDSQNLFNLQNLTLQKLLKMKKLSSYDMEVLKRERESLLLNFTEHLLAKGHLCAIDKLLDVFSDLREPKKALIKAKVQWKRRNFPRAKFLLSNQLKSEQLSLTEAAQIQFQLAKFGAESCSESTETITKLIESAKEKFFLSEGSRNELRNCYLTLAKFADEQYEKIQRYLRSEDCQKVNERIKIVQRELDLIEQNNQEKTSYYQKLKMRQETDKAEQEKVLRQRSGFLWQAMESYFLCLSSTEHSAEMHDLSVLRIVALWFQNHNDSNLNSFLNKKFEEASVDSFGQVLPQFIGRLAGSENKSTGYSEFEILLQKMIIAICKKHFFHGIYNLLAVVNSEKEVNNFSAYVKYTADSQRVRRGKEVVEKLRSSKPLELKAVEALVDAYMHAAYFEKGKKYLEGDFKRQEKIMKIENLHHVPMPTIELPVCKDGDYSSFPTVLKFQKKFQVPGGLNRPKVVKVHTSDGSELRQIVKGNDDLRQDAVMQQVFRLCNRLLGQSNEAKKRNLSMATYKVVPIAPSSGVLEWCENTTTLADYLIGSSKKPGAHPRYRPQDLSILQCRDKLIGSRGNPQKADALLEAFSEICDSVKPVFHMFFLETFSTPEKWFQTRLRYTRSVAVSSIVGYILGLGDRHTSNILFNEQTAEVVHIDLGMAFEQV